MLGQLVNKVKRISLSIKILYHRFISLLSVLLFYPKSSQPKAGGFEHGEEIPMEAESQDRSPDDGGALPSLCLKQVYPKYTKQFNYLRLVERIAALFIRFLGVKGNMRLGPTAFRTFIRYE